MPCDVQTFSVNSETSVDLITVIMLNVKFMNQSTVNLTIHDDFYRFLFPQHVRLMMQIV